MGVFCLSGNRQRPPAAGGPAGAGGITIDQALFAAGRKEPAALYAARASGAPTT